ncbi:hypothetical protein ACFLUC_03810 [Chloroflexota bacterium]
MAIVLGLMTVQHVAAASYDQVWIENYFISCEEVSIKKVWTINGINYVRERHLKGEVISNTDFNTGEATNMENTNVELGTGYGTFFGRLEMYPKAYPDGGWKGYFFIKGLPGDQTGSAWLRGTGSLSGYYTKSSVKHVPGSTLHKLFPDACDGNMPVGGSHGKGFVVLPNDD